MVDRSIMVYGETPTAFDVGTVLREGVAVAGILFVWLGLAAFALLIADLAPRTGPIRSLATALAWFLSTVGFANALFYVVLKAIAYHHAFVRESRPG